MLNKHFISAEDLLQDAFRLALKVYQSGFRPDYIVGVWRGGTPVGIAVQEMLKVCRIDADHFAIRTASYTGIGTRGKDVSVHGLEYLVDRVRPDSTVLIVDDVFDTGLSIAAVKTRLQQLSRVNTPRDIRVATPWYKPANNKTDAEPDYFLHQTGEWLVFPHEIEGLTREELIRHRPDIAGLMAEFEVMPEL